MERPMRYAYEIYIQKSFSKAAESLYISQPALSAIIRKLEDELNTVLFDRSTKPIRLTDSGKYYIHCAEQIMAIEKSMNHYFEDLSELHEGNISLGTSTYFCSNILPRLLKEFQRQYPNIHFQITESNSTPELKELLRRGDLDFSLTSNTYQEDEFEGFVHDKEAIILAVPHSHKINKLFREYEISYDDIVNGDIFKKEHPSVPLNAFQEEEFITISKISDLYPRILAMFGEYQIQPKIVMHLQQMSSCYFLAANDFGSTILRASTLQCVKDTGNLCFYAIDSSKATRTSRFYYKKGIYLSKAMRAFQNFIQSRKESEDPLT